ncbi:hypothetical protein AYI70_g4597 [Smittium culicis]|uniref:Lysophospholipid acyltransferase LPEAT1 n=1 Tax=Smittium culicis TaxID=133412 RepID=A0A1R1XY86_9FUNG|nr:hypothetical protein AYI70_g4597 [Smittium culicis]
MKMIPMKGYSALFASLRPPNALLNSSSVKSLSEITAEARSSNNGPVVVFPENTTSNGKALLNFLPIFADSENIDPESNIFIFALKYSYKNFSPTYSIGSAFKHLFGLCSQFYNKLSVVEVEQASCPKFSDGENTSNIKSNPNDSDIDEEYSLDEEIRKLVVACSRLRQTKLTALDKLDFIRYYNERTKIYK